jgi:cyclophilin family peptidyl-prolyl cis-trans isomerase
MFSAALYNYSSKANPRIFMTLSMDGNKMGDLVIEVYQNHSPRSAENFLNFVNGCSVGSYKGTTFTGGFPGIVLTGGRVTPCNASSDGGRQPDDGLTLRHSKRGIVSFTNDGENANGSEFQIALSDSANLLDGYHSVVGELVEGCEVLSQAEQSLSRHGTLDHSIKIEDCGTR